MQLFVALVLPAVNKQRARHRRQSIDMKGQNKVIRTCRCLCAIASVVQYLPEQVSKNEGMIIPERKDAVKHSQL